MTEKNVIMKSEEYPGYWDASEGGSAQKGEGLLECAKRELFEGTGINASEFELIDISFRDKSHSYIYSYIIYVDCDKDSVLLQEEAVDYQWVYAEGLLKYAQSKLAIKTKIQRYKKVYDQSRSEKNNPFFETKKCSGTKSGRLVANRELPALKCAKDIMESF